MQPRLQDRRQLVHELFGALRRGFLLGQCRTCETFYLMAKLCLEEGGPEGQGDQRSGRRGGSLTPDEHRDVESWVEAGSILDLDFGCEDACAIVPLYGRLQR